jgi:hypothetical protein
MKTYIGILALTALLFTACNTPEGATSRAYSDDVYYTSQDVAADKQKHKQKLQEEKQRAAEARRAEENSQAAAKTEAETDDYYKVTEKRTDDEGNTYVTNNYYDEPFEYDDYYDYEYAARLRRFHNNVGYYGYYDNYYTNTYYYTYDPYYYGTSVYMGYNFWGPSYAVYSYNPGFYWYSNYGWCNDPWYNPYGYNPYMNGYSYGYYNGYNNGYWNGYYNGYYHSPQNNYFNSYDNNSYYYGPRGTMSANSRAIAQPSLAHRYVDHVEAETQKPFEATHGRDNNQHMKPTTVSDYMSKPVRGENYNSKPVVPANNDNSRPSNATKPVYNERPANNNVEQKPVYIDNQRPAEKPVYEQKPTQQRPTYQQKPVEKPAEKPVYKQKPRETYQAPTPAPRNNNSTGGSRSGSTPAPSSGPRKR